MVSQYAKMCETFDMMPLADQVIFISNRIGFAKDDTVEWEFKKRQLDKF